MPAYFDTVRFERMDGNEGTELVTEQGFEDTSTTYDERNLPVGMAVTPSGDSGSGTGDLILSYRYSAGGQRYWTDECAGQAGCEAEYYVLDGSETMGVFRVRCAHLLERQ